MTDVAILGAGAWGTAIAIHAATRAAARPRVLLYARTATQAHALERERENRRYLPGVGLPPAVTVTNDIAAAAAADVLLLATPVGALPSLIQTLLSTGRRPPLALLSKGFVLHDGFPQLASDYLGAHWGAPLAIVSGPSFAGEVARGLPTALAVAAASAGIATQVANLLRSETLRVYESDDMAGVQAGGAVKNVLAIAAGASDGLGFGNNARAALVTRGLAEARRLTLALGGRRDTVMGLAGLGDLVLTCTGDASRNRRVGLALASGTPLQSILDRLGHVAEGVAAARAVRTLATRHALDMPICQAVDRVLHEALPVRDAVAALLRREPRSESE